MPRDDFKTYLHERKELIDRHLDLHLPSEKELPPKIHEAMRYPVFAGGKRLRPILTLAAAEACGGREEDALFPACATELLHTYSLVHDDLPSMDDDDLRRGRPTTHVVFGEAVAVLAGDALQAEAFHFLSQAPPSRTHGMADYLKEFALCAGSKHLIGGQILDLEGEGADNLLSQEELIAIHERKTAALLTTSIRLGAMTAGVSEQDLFALTDFGYNLGLAFQVIDDILDVTADTATLGKTAGKDEAVNKSTYPAILGLAESRAEAKRLTELSLAALAPFGKKATRLSQIAHYLLDRDY
ncbi:polyprenyl synthetase family protein [Roseibacillus ishigakijimensis]|uniref:Polyprenyl synthetase family protein n=1 Tax=Roseibacillus ishigakijimensis TaxID=454146 RepID=A0A934RIX8_9BACT|nr:farnesyl diphosphate synthase [Roseibacillus ishigakijimensis]MBK1832477.1 polyprenyl synthetase family protein [Roseibacillus ishigakijimensis]